MDFVEHAKSNFEFPAALIVFIFRAITFPNVSVNDQKKDRLEK
jgi:hypothetical protein